MVGGGARIERAHTVPGRSRYTVETGDGEELGGEAVFSTQVESDVPVVVERSMYFASGGHNTLGAMEPSTAWYLAEGYTGEDFETHIVVQNPNEQAAELTVSYLLQEGGVLERAHTAPANGRYTIRTRDEGQVGPNSAFSTIVKSDVPVVAERAVYFGNGGHSTIGAAEPSTMWFLAEGFTGDGFGTYMLVLNPNSSAAELSARYLLQGGGAVERTHTVPAESRYTIVAQDEGELGPGAAFSTILEADLPVVVERAMYFGNGGHSTIGATAPATRWHLAEGYTGDAFGTYILILNPNGSPAEIMVSYMLESGDVIDRSHSVPAESRYTIVTQADWEVGTGAAFSATVQSNVPVIVERAMYFWNGGHNTIAYAE